jgi:hypothetical protein
VVMLVVPARDFLRASGLAGRLRSRTTWPW